MQRHTDESAVHSHDRERFYSTVRVCGDSHMIVEATIKACIAGLENKKPKHTHSIVSLVNELSSVRQNDVIAQLQPIDIVDWEGWRSAASYIAEESSTLKLKTVTPRLAADMLSGALRICTYAALEIPGPLDTLSELKEKIQQAHTEDAVAMLRGEPPFAAQTYVGLGLLPHPEAV